MSYTYGVVHGIATCEDCGWHTDSYKNAQAIAKIHAKKYGHKVRGELGISFEYDYRGVPKVTRTKCNGGLRNGR
jgi:hypothetical protein